MKGCLVVAFLLLVLCIPSGSQAQSHNDQVTTVQIKVTFPSGESFGGVMYAYGPLERTIKKKYLPQNFAGILRVVKYYQKTGIIDLNQMVLGSGGNTIDVFNMGMEYAVIGGFDLNTD